MECQWFFILLLVQSEGNGAKQIKNQPIASHVWQKYSPQYGVRLLQLSACAGTTMFVEELEAMQRCGALRNSQTEFYAVSIFNMSLY
jgi:hypothetical protein